MTNERKRKKSMKGIDMDLNGDLMKYDGQIELENQNNRNYDNIKKKRYMNE